MEDVFILLTDKYADKINGIRICNDRVIIQGYIPEWSYVESMASYLKANNIRIFDFADFSQSLTEQVRADARRIADENGIEIKFTRKLCAFRKGNRIQEIIQKTSIGISVFLRRNFAICVKNIYKCPNKSVLLSLLNCSLNDLNEKN